MPEVTEIKTTHVAFGGELRFEDEVILEDFLDTPESIELRAFEDARQEVEDIDDVPFEPLFRKYKSYIAIEHLPDVVTTFTVEPISTDPLNLPLVFKPAKRDVTLDSSAPHRSVNAHFKVKLGRLIEGSIRPPLDDVKVIIQRENRLSLRDRVPSVVYSDANGRYRHGPVEKDKYEVLMEKDGWTFRSEDGYNFLATEIPRVTVKVVDISHQAMSDVKI